MKAIHLASKINYYVLVVIITFVLGVLFGIALRKDYSTTAQEVVKCMYTYTTPDEWISNDKRLQALCSEDVYNQLTAKEKGSLHYYLGLNKELCGVQIDEVNNNTVFFHLTSEQISSDRKFAFYFETDFWGKIVKVRESELYDFITSD